MWPFVIGFFHFCFQTYPCCSMHQYCICFYDKKSFYIIVQIYHRLSSTIIHSSIDGRLGCYQFFIITNNAAMNSRVQVSCERGEVLFVFVCLFLLFRAVPVAYRSSQARSWNVATADGHSHSHKGSELHLQPTPQLMATPDPWPTEQGQGSNPQPHGS